MNSRMRRLARLEASPAGILARAEARIRAGAHYEDLTPEEFEAFADSAPPAMVAWVDSLSPEDMARLEARDSTGPFPPPHTWRCNQ